MDSNKLAEMFIKYSFAIFIIQKIIFVIVILLLHSSIIKYNWEKMFLISILIVLAIVPL